MKIYYESVGRNSLLLLNVPADSRGLIHEVDSVRLMELRAALDEIFSVDLSEGAEVDASNVRGGSRRFKPQNLLSDDFDKYWAVVMDDTPALQSFTDTIVDLDGIAKKIDTSWYVSTLKEFTLTTAAQLFGFAELSRTIDFKGVTIKLGADIVCNEDGSINMDQLKEELCAFHFMINEVPKVYSEVTGGLLSYPNYYAESVLSVFMTVLFLLLMQNFHKNTNNVPKHQLLPVLI